MPDSVLNAWREALLSIPAEFNWLLREVTIEVNNPEFGLLRHGTRHARNQGCQGPLCQKALRDAQRAIRVRRARLAGLEPRPYTRSKRYVAMDPMLDRLKRAHDKEFDSRPKSQLESAGVAS